MLSRRHFLGGTFCAGLVAAVPRSASAQAPVARPGERRVIVDAQVHQWKAETPDRPWVPGRKAQLPEPFGYDKLLPMMNEAGVAGVVIVPPSWEGERNDYALEAAGRYPDRFSVMGRIPLTDPAGAARLSAWKQQPGMRGIRMTFGGPELALLASGTVDWLWTAAEAAGVPIMFMSADMEPFHAIAERHPRLALIIDHMGLSLEIAKADRRAEAIARTVAFARHPNVSCKLSSAPAYSAEAYPWRDMAPHIRRVFEAFGPQRCYWGTDMTNSFNKATYRQRVTQFTEELDFLSESDKDWIMGRAILARLGWT